MIRDKINGFEKNDLFISLNVGLTLSYFENLDYTIKIIMLISGSLLCL
jgi:hypothetical protein